MELFAIQEIQAEEILIKPAPKAPKHKTIVFTDDNDNSIVARELAEIALEPLDLRNYAEEEGMQLTASSNGIEVTRTIFPVFEESIYIINGILVLHENIIVDTQTGEIESYEDKRYNIEPIEIMAQNAALAEEKFYAEHNVKALPNYVSFGITSIESLKRNNTNELKSR